MKNSTYRYIQSTTIIFIVEILLAHLVYDKNLFTATLSEYAIGEYWYIVSSGLILIAINYTLLSFKFSEIEIFNNKLARIGSCTLIFVSLNTFLLTIFQTGQANFQGRIHVVAAHLHFIFLPISACLLTITIKNRAYLIYKYITLVFSLILVLVGLGLSFKAYFGIGEFSGLVQKSLIFLILFWIIFTSSFLNRRSNEKEKVIEA